MTKDPSRTIGKIDCMVCGEEMPVRQNGRDTLNLSCQWCGHSSYAKGGTEAQRIMSGRIRKDGEPAAQVAAPEPAAPVVEPLPPEPVPAAKKQPAAMPWEL